MTRMPGSIGSVTWQGGSMATASSNELHQLHQFQGSRISCISCIFRMSRCQPAFVQSAVRCQPSFGPRRPRWDSCCAGSRARAEAAKKHASIINVCIVHWILDTYSMP